MNQNLDPSPMKDPLKRGELARKLLKRAMRSRRARVPDSSLTPDEGTKQPDAQPKVLGPYCNRSKWRLIIKEGQGRKSLVFETREQAEAVRQQLLSKLEDRVSKTIGEMVEEYLVHKRNRGCIEKTVHGIRDRVLGFLDSKQSLNSITPNRAETLYALQIERFAVATHQKALRDVKAFFRYCVRQKYIASSPFIDVQPVGKPNVGKPQLRTDEARKLSDHLISAATKGDTRALALLLQVLLGLRSGEVLNLRKRDLDRGGKVIVVDGTKSKNAKRILELHAPVARELLIRRCAILPADGLIFARDGASTPSFAPRLWKGLRVYCRRAGVPIVCPHSLRGLHSTLAVKAGATAAYVAQALGHGSDVVTRRHYIEPSALDAARSARVAGVLLGETNLDTCALPSE